ncbi:MAG: helix-turn-helix domain-containing protein [Lactococcus sp.]|uniref:HTH cro/C1-type domain-containing protein n=2 Tax=Pseudolactococcus TaxID=3436058 RepID=A0A7L4WBL2_9LACT
MTVTSDRIKLSRKNKGLTMDQLANIMGVAQSAIVRWENGTTQVKPDKIGEISKILNVSPLYLLGYIDTPKEEIMTFDSGEEFMKEWRRSSNTPSQGKEIALSYGKGNELKNIEVKKISLKDSYKNIAMNLASSLSDTNNEKWLEYGNLLLNSENEQKNSTNK